MKRREARWVGCWYELDHWVSDDRDQWELRDGRPASGPEWDKIISIDLKGGPRDGATVY